MPNGHDLAGRYIDFVEKTASRISALETDNITNKAAITLNAKNIQGNRDRIVTTNEAILKFKAWVEKSMGGVAWKAAVAVGGIVGLLGGVIYLITLIA